MNQPLSLGTRSFAAGKSIVAPSRAKSFVAVIGHGPMHDQLARMIEEKGVGDVIALIGPKSQDEVARKMAAAAFFVLPSIIAGDGQMEGIPVSLMEAMASGRAVISTSISGIPELIDDGVSGLLVPPDDATALARAMHSLLASPDRRPNSASAIGSIPFSPSSISSTAPMRARSKTCSIVGARAPKEP